MVIITTPGIQKLTLLEIIAYVLLTTNTHSSGFASISLSCAAVVYQPKKIGMKEMSAGKSHTLANMRKTVR